MIPKQAIILEEEENVSIKQAINGLNSDEWYKAMANKMKLVLKNKIWDEVSTEE